MSVECTSEVRLARSIDEVDGVCAALPACMAYRFLSTIKTVLSPSTRFPGANGEAAASTLHRTVCLRLS